MIAIEQYVLVVPSVILYKVVLTFESEDEIPSVIIQMKAIEQYVSVVQSVIVYKVVPSFEFVNEILLCDYSNESYRAICSCGTVCHSIPGGSNF